MHPIRLLAQILSHPYVKEVLTKTPEDEGLKLHAEDISIEDYPGYVFLSTLLSRLKTPSNEVILFFTGPVGGRSVSPG